MQSIRADAAVAQPNCEQRRQAATTGLTSSLTDTSVVLPRTSHRHIPSEAANLRMVSLPCIGATASYTIGTGCPDLTLHGHITITGGLSMEQNTSSYVRKTGPFAN